ncbi:MAG: hypothetical protein ACLFQX_00245 [Candidatus Kapaibacterium sp.]
MRKFLLLLIIPFIFSCENSNEPDDNIASQARLLEGYSHIILVYNDVNPFEDTGEFVSREHHWDYTLYMEDVYIRAPFNIIGDTVRAYLHQEQSPLPNTEIALRINPKSHEIEFLSLIVDNIESVTEFGEVVFQADGRLLIEGSGIPQRGDSLVYLMQGNEIMNYCSVSASYEDWNQPDETFNSSTLDIRDSTRIRIAFE